MTAKGTRVYGASDDLIEFAGDFRGEVAASGTEEGDAAGVLVLLSDGTVLAVKYGKLGEGIWQVAALKKGQLFDRIDLCDDAEADPYSDVAHFRPGIKWAFAAREWEKVS